MATLTIWIPDSLVAFVDAQVAAKRCTNKSEYFLSLLLDARTKDEKEEALNEALLMEEGVVMSEQIVPSLIA